MREKIIGNTRVLNSDGSSGVPVDYKQGARIIQRKQAQGLAWDGLDVVNELDPNARYQPAEGGRTYTEDQFNKEFIGKFASENPDIADLFLIRIKENDGNTLEEYDYKIIIYDKETKKPVARSKWQLFENDENGKLEDAAADVEILNDAYKGMKLSHLMQSERLERSRSLGAEAVRSQITNQEGIPIKNYAKTIGADKGEIASALADRFDEDGLIKYIPATIENFKQEMDLSKAHHDGIWKPTVYYRAKLDPKAWYQPAEGGRTYTDEQMSSKFIGRYAAENANLAKGLSITYYSRDGEGVRGVDGDLNTSKFYLEIKDKKTGELIGDINAEYGRSGTFFDGTKDVNGLVLTNISVNVQDEHRGKGYQHLLYSELFERARASGAIGFTQKVENKLGIPLKSIRKIVGENGSKIWTLSDWEPVNPTQENFDKLMANAPVFKDFRGTHQPYVQNNGALDPKAWYQPAEKIGTQSSNVDLLLKGMESGRILRTSSYKGLGLEDAILIAHTPDTAKIGQVTAGDKALADLQGGIFYAIANGKKIWASNFAGEGETNTLVQFANDQLKNNPNKKTYILLVKPSSGDNSKIFASVDGARGVSNIFKHLNDSKVMTDLRYVAALKDSAEMHLGIKGLEGLGKEELYAKIDNALLNSKANKIGFDQRREFTKDIARQLDKSGAFDSKRSKKALVNSFHEGFEGGFSIAETKRVFGNLMAEDIIKNVPAGHVYGALEITSPLMETPDSGHRGYDASIEQENGSPARLIMFDRTDHVTNIVNKKSGKEIAIHNASEGSYHSHTGGQIPYQEVKGKSQMPFQPAEGWRDWQSERTSVGSVIKNTAGYVIMVQRDKFKVYNPYKAMIGIYDNEDQAKRRVQKDEPRR